MVRSIAIDNSEPIDMGCCLGKENTKHKHFWGIALSLGGRQRGIHKSFGVMLSSVEESTRKQNTRENPGSELFMCFVSQCFLFVRKL